MLQDLLDLLMMCLCFLSRSYQEAGGGGDPLQVPQQDPGKLSVKIPGGGGGGGADLLQVSSVLLTCPARPGDHRALRAGEVSPSAGQNQVPGAA